MPILKDAKSKGQNAHIVVDKLYVEGKLYMKPDSTYAASAENHQELIVLKRPIAFHSSRLLGTSVCCRTKKKHRTD